MGRTRKKCIRDRVNGQGVCVTKLLTNAAWYEQYTTPHGRVTCALECDEHPDEVTDLLESYGITKFDWHFLGTHYVYW